jgi:amino acid adenylation domain-containing protein
VGELSLLTSSERHQLLVEWNQTTMDYPRDKCVHQLFEMQVERTPNAAAVAFEDQCLTYAELNAQSNRLARYLQRHGVRSGSFVASCMERSSDLIVTLLATLKAGGAYVALDTNIPSRRLHSILDNTRPAVIVVKSQQEKDSLRLMEGAQIASLPIVICLDEDAQSISNESAENLDSDATSEGLAYVCFTSGSSGQPKGVCVPHRAIVRLVKNVTYVSLSASDVFLQFAPISFDASTFEIWGCLLNGGQLAVLPSEMSSLAQLGSAIRKYNVSVLWLTAGLFHQMVDHELDSLAGVRQLLAGGDVLSTAHVRKTLGRLGQGRLINGYGPTENTTFTCCYSITDLFAEEHSVPIGRPISNTQCFILDRNLQPVPIGVRGELFTGGEGLARCYLNDPKLTAEKFIPNPFHPASLLYRTGDFARYRSDGNIEFLGRIDNQVKIRGYRIEPGEIESVLKLHPAAREAVVAAREDVPGDRRLVAYVAPASATAKVTELQEFLKERLPAYMFPSAFVFIDAFPLTSNGKIDSKALPAPEGRSPELERSYVAPRTPTEELLARIWCEILNLKQVGIYDDFFELGGHSLLVVRLLSQIQRTLKIEVPFAVSTIARLAEYIQATTGNAASQSLVPLRASGAGSPLFLVSGRTWHAMYYRHLVSDLKSDRPVFGLQPPPLDGKRRIPRTIGSMAADYVAEIRRVQPHGPYFLAGHSFGGQVSFEMAQQLVCEGERVSFLGLIDTGFRDPPVEGWHWASEAMHLSRRVRHVDSFQDLLFQGLRFMRNTVLDLRIRQGRSIPYEHRAAYYEWLCTRADLNYVSRPYTGHVTMFCRAGNSERQIAHWAPFAGGGLTVLEVPAGHVEMVLPPHSKVLAEHFDDCLDATENELPWP